MTAPPTTASSGTVGITRGGFDCQPGAAQFDSAYAAPCRPSWSGDNGGATHRGITGDSIKMVLRRYADSPDNLFVEQVFAQAGTAPEKVTAEVRRVFVEYFNQVYELYGRRLVIEDYTTKASLIEEVNGKGREQACADATAIAEEHRAFGVLPPTGGVGPGSGMYFTFGECAVQRRLFLPVGPLYAPEEFYVKAHPHAWALTVECDRFAHMMAEYIGKRLAGKPARWARDTRDVDTRRVFGLLAADIGAYRTCFELLERELEQRYGVTFSSRYNYTVDQSRTAQETAQAAAQFKAAGVTTVIIGDPFTTASLTAHARSQQWGPEWLMVGLGGQDIEHFARLYDQDRVDGHLFGLSFLGPTEARIGPDSEPGRLYRKLTGKELPDRTDGDYFSLIHLFNLLQAAGPGLTPDAIATGAGSLPPLGGPGFEVGRWSFHSSPDGSPGRDHSTVDDAREVYWDGRAAGYDGKAGTFIATYEGRRFTNGQWPIEDPPIYPAPCPNPCTTQARARESAWRPSPDFSRRRARLPG